MSDADRPCRTFPGFGGYQRLHLLPFMVGSQNPRAGWSSIHGRTVALGDTPDAILAGMLLDGPDSAS